MKKLLENKLVVGGVCIVIAAILAFLVLPGMYKQKEKTIMICRLQSDITAGTRIEAEMLKSVEVGSYGLPESVISVPSNAASVANQLKAGDKVTVAYYADDNVIIDNALKGMEIYSVENEDAQNLENVQGSEDKEDEIAANVTLIATEEQAAKLINAEYSGKLHIILENRGVA